MKAQRVIPMNERETIYRDFEGGRMTYFTYSDGDKVYVARSWAEDQVCRGYARYVDCSK